MQAFVDHLRTTDDGQCQTQLRVDKTQPDGTVKRLVCAEGALIDVALELGLSEVAWQPRTAEPVYDRTLYRVAPRNGITMNDAPAVVHDFMQGTVGGRVMGVLPGIDGSQSILTLNDVFHLTFTELADAVARYYELDEPTGRPTDAVDDAG